MAHGDIPVNSGRLRAKIVVFDTSKNMRAFWNRRLGLTKHSDIGPRCLGAVNRLSLCFEKIPEGTRTIQFDRRYFCVIGLLKKHLTMRIISHESVHAGYAFEKRRSRSWWDVAAKRLDEEAIAYPTGEIAAGIVRFLTRKKLL